jgi:hypothetical protein
MKVRVKKWSGPELRLFLAAFLCIVFFVATPTSPTNGDKCVEDVGYLSIKNNSSNWVCEFSVSGPQSALSRILPGAQESITLKPGVYTYSAVFHLAPEELDLIDILAAKSGSVTIEFEKTTTLTLEL